MNPNLTTLANVKAWAAIDDSGSDSILNSLIPRISRSILSYLNRDTLYQNSYTDYYDATNTDRQILRNWPVLSVSSVYSGNQLIPAGSPAPNLTSGYFLEPANSFPPGRPQSIILRGYRFRGGALATQITYVAGYVVQNEAATVPASPYQITAAQPLGTWMNDSGVTYADGTVLVKVTGTPAQGEYAVANGLYTFAAADSGQSILLSYSYVPQDVENATIEWIIERYSYKDRVGQTSKSAGGVETTSFALENIPRFVKLVLQNYVRVVPI